MDKTVDGRIKEILATNGSHLFVESIISRIDTPHLLIDFLHRYIVFNGYFAGGVANLAGAFHIRNDLFLGPEEDLPSCAHAAAEIASHIFFAAEDEYGSRAEGARVTHRRLAQFLLRETLRHYNIGAAQFATEYPLNEETVRTLYGVLHGYKLNRPNSERDLLDGLGFHLGSEVLADQEFNIIASFLSRSFPKLVEHLSATTNATGQSAYDWIRVHTFVEEEHFNTALGAAELVLQTYRGSLSKQEVFDRIIEGFLGFATLQKRFFSHILDSGDDRLDRTQPLSIVEQPLTLNA